MMNENYVRLQGLPFLHQQDSLGYFLEYFVPRASKFVILRPVCPAPLDARAAQHRGPPTHRHTVQECLPSWHEAEQSSFLPGFCTRFRTVQVGPSYGCSCAIFILFQSQQGSVALLLPLVLEETVVQSNFEKSCKASGRRKLHFFPGLL